MLLVVVGLGRLESLHRVVNGDQLKLVIEAIRLIDVTNSYMTLRQIDASNPKDSKHIVVDLPDEETLTHFLKQVINIINIII